MGNFSVAGEGQTNESGLTCIIRFSLPKRDRCGASLPEARTASAARVVRLDDDGPALESRKRFAGFYYVWLVGRGAVKIPPKFNVYPCNQIFWTLSRHSKNTRICEVQGRSEAIRRSAGKQN
jgi:recombinational DNA repair protein RecR